MNFVMNSVIVETVDPKEFYSHPSEWAQLTLQLNDVGSVAVSSAADGRVGGSGYVLATSVPITILVPPTQKLYMCTQGSAHRVSVVIQQVPISMLLNLFSSLINVVKLALPAKAPPSLNRR